MKLHNFSPIFISKLMHSCRYWMSITFNGRKFLLLMNNLFWPGNSISSIFIFRKSLLTCENLTMTVGFFLLILWQASMRSVRILHPSFSKMATTFSSKASASTSLGILTMSRHFRLEYCAFNQHWRSILTSLLDRIVLTCFVTDTSACNLEKD